MCGSDFKNALVLLSLVLSRAPVSGYAWTRGVVPSAATLARGVAVTLAVNQFTPHIVAQAHAEQDPESGHAPGSPVDMFERSPEGLWEVYEAAMSMDERATAAEALTGWMRIATDGNTVTIDGPGDRPEFREIWAKHAQTAVNLYEQVLKEDPENPVHWGNYVEAFSSLCSAKGVIKAALTGDALAFMSKVNKMEKSFPEHCDGLAHIFATAFSIAAPFPVRSIRKAVAKSRKALEVNPRSKRNLYYAGLASFYNKDLDEARKMFSAALSAEVFSQSEMDIAKALDREAARGLAACGDGAAFEATTSTTEEGAAAGEEGEQEQENGEL